ncbi:MAG: HIRAN domain-containing protein [Bacteroidales bacterium]|nr:HIRAN domain-containing protein [Candidatus Equimonas enterica]
MQLDKKFLMTCHIAGRQYYDADEVWPELAIGTRLTLERDADNRYDGDAVAVYYSRPICEDTGEKERFLLGYLPSADNALVASLLDMGWGEILECRLSRIKPDAHYEEQLHVTLHIKKK